MITPDFTAYAVRIELHLHDAVPSPELQARLESLLAAIARECMANGATLIGHIKCLATATDKGYLAVSVVDTSTAPRSRGHLEDGVLELEVVLNVLLYGLSREKVERIVEKLSRSELRMPGAYVHLVELDEHEHGEGHDHSHHGHEHH